MAAKKGQSEAELCAEFIRYAESSSHWVAYAETGGFDIVLAAPDGLQIGVHAKKRFTPTLLRQALPDGHGMDCAGPHYRAVLLPDAEHDVSEVCHCLGIVLFRRCTSYTKQHRQFIPNLMQWQDWPIWFHDRRVKLPAYVPDVPAGCKSPVQLTEWKIAALRIVALIDVRGYVTREDFRRVGIDHRRWTSPLGTWLRWIDDGKYGRGPGLDFDKQHPRVFAQIVEETKRLLQQEAE